MEPILIDYYIIDCAIASKIPIKYRYRTDFGNPGCQSKIPKFHAQDVCLDKTYHVEMEVASMVQDILRIKLSKAHTNYS